MHWWPHNNTLTVHVLFYKLFYSVGVGGGCLLTKADLNLAQTYLLITIIV